MIETCRSWGPITVAVILLATVAPRIEAAGNVSEQIWADFHGHFYLTPNWEYYGDGGYRTDPGLWQKVYVRPSLRLHETHHAAEGRGGIGLFYTYSDVADNQFEFRPWTGLFLKWPRIGPLTLSSYLRLEGRFVWDTDTGAEDQTLRFRYKLGTKFPLKRGDATEYFYIPVSGEWFEDLTTDISELFAEEWRFDIGLGRLFGNKMVGEFHVMVQRSRAGRGEAFQTNDYIFRFVVKRLWSSREYMSQEP